jgi:hypothetical protein
MDDQLVNDKRHDSNDIASQSLPPSKKLKLNVEGKGDGSDHKATSTTTTATDNQIQQHQHAALHEQYLQIPPEIQAVDFKDRVSWGKFQPYSNIPAPIVPVGTEPQYDLVSSPALCHHINAICGRARACTIHVQPPQPQPQHVSRVNIRSRIAMPHHIGQYVSSSHSTWYGIDK